MHMIFLSPSISNFQQIFLSFISLSSPSSSLSQLIVPDLSCWKTLSIFHFITFIEIFKILKKWQNMSVFYLVSLPMPKTILLMVYIYIFHTCNWKLHCFLDVDDTLYSHSYGFSNKCSKNIEGNYIMMLRHITWSSNSFFKLFPCLINV